jgi:dienelactone hydrolase
VEEWSYRSGCRVACCSLSVAVTKGSKNCLDVLESTVSPAASRRPVVAKSVFCMEMAERFMHFMTRLSSIVIASVVSGGLVLGTRVASASESAREIGEQVARDLVSENFASVANRMSAEMAAGLPQAGLAEIWSSLVGQLGPCNGLGEASSEEASGFTAVRVPMKFRARTLDLKISVAREKIVGFFVVPHEEPVSAWRLPTYADPHAYLHLEVKVGADPNSLPGTLFLPNGVPNAPAVILVHGSGPQDRDETLGPNRPFRDLATGLATRGVAVLSYDKRTKVYPQSFVQLKNGTVKQETLDDVDLAVELLQSRPEIDPRQIVVVGHSLGGALAPRIAAANSSVAKIVILAGATRSLPDIAVAQVEYLASLKGPIDEAAAEQIKELKAEAARARAARSGDEGAPFLGVPLSYWADLNQYDPAATAAGLTIPILALQGGRDYQVTTEDFSRFQSALANHANATCRLLPSLNHQLMSGVGRSTPAEYETPGHVDAEVIDLIAAFVLSR